MKRRLGNGSKFFLIVFFIATIWTSGFFLLVSLKKNLEFYITPSDVLTNNKINKEEKVRIGGMIVHDSIKRLENGGVKFTITDYTHNIDVFYYGTDLPPLFKEGLGIISRGYLADKNSFQADQLISKHDEKYMPKKNLNK